MTRGGFLLLSLALHAAVAGAAWRGLHCTAPPSLTPRAEERLLPLVVEGAPSSAPEGERGLAATTSPLRAPTLARPPGGTLAASAFVARAPLRRATPGGQEASSATATVNEGASEGAAESLFGSLPLRAVLVSLSARSDLFGEDFVQVALTYDAHAGGDDGPLVSVRSSSGDRSAEAVVALLRRYLSQALARNPAHLEGFLTVRVAARTRREEVFVITCDERKRRGSVQFTDGRRLEVEAR